uniref:WGS project CBMI000000000 data, contig CS3069_c004198 n=1 Tax=Fusarium clavum TaxID=2594811 RepID=A0A090MEB9_9HYPO|nr:unnamed protein product [Fusarium clavum]
MSFLCELSNLGRDYSVHISRLNEATRIALFSRHGHFSMQSMLFGCIGLGVGHRRNYGKIFLFMACGVGLMTWASAVEYKIYDGKTHGLWRTGGFPNSPLACQQRLEDKQYILLDTYYYNAQFARTVVQNLTNRSNLSESFNYPVFNESRFLQIHNDANICYQGFEGNQDLYGLGVRLCMYLQWIAALITNNFLPDTRQTFRSTWLIFSMAMCVLAFVASFASYCTFSVEMEILYWMYWGGFACVYASAPCQIRLGGGARWVGLNWDNTIRYTMHTLMAYHGLWFSWWGYDQVFARLPCGTYHFILAKFLDPSIPYSHARDVLSVVLNFIALPLLPAIPVAIIVMAAEIKASIEHSAVYRMLFRSGTGHTQDHLATSVPTRASDRFLDMARKAYYFVRTEAGLPGHRLGDIRLITPVDAQHRWSVAL